jgi:uncharacterized protein
MEMLMMMNAKTERFEMRLDPDTLQRIDDWREHQDRSISRAEAIRTLVDVGLERINQPRFSDGEKLNTLLLCHLIQSTGASTEFDPRFLASVIYGGHYWALDWEYPGLFHDETDRRETVTEVVDILDMWTFIEDGFDALSPDQKRRVTTESQWGADQIRFSGFDGNNEGKHFSIANFLVREMERFSRFSDGRSLNSHTETVGGNLKMFRVFEPIRVKLVGRKMSGDEIVTVMEARRARLNSEMLVTELPQSSAKSPP